MPRGCDQVRANPDDEDGESDQNALERFRRSATQRLTRENKDHGKREDESRPDGHRDHRLEREQRDEYREREGPGERGGEGCVSAQSSGF